ncbi:unnamed protein product, partial [marine sediment metagenome]
MSPSQKAAYESGIQARLAAGSKLVSEVYSPSQLQGMRVHYPQIRPNWTMNQLNAFLEPKAGIGGYGPPEPKLSLLDRFRFWRLGGGLEKPNLTFPTPAAIVQSFRAPLWSTHYAPGTPSSGVRLTVGQPSASSIAQASGALTLPVAPKLAPSLSLALPLGALAPLAFALAPGAVGATQPSLTASQLAEMDLNVAGNMLEQGQITQTQYETLTESIVTAEQETTNTQNLQQEVQDLLDETLTEQQLQQFQQQIQ